MEYAKSKVEDLMRLCVKVDALIELANVGRRWLIFFCCCHNFKMVGCYELSCSCIAHFCDRMDTLFHRVLLLQNRLNGNPLGIVEPLLLSAISSLEDTPVMGFKGEFSKP
uniref:Uncharacterized protein n=1 Tax=Quercus lobata TaxID=97700 RepID=A0A7N2M1A7_QUELO